MVITAHRSAVTFLPNRTWLTLCFGHKADPVAQVPPPLLNHPQAQHPTDRTTPPSFSYRPPHRRSPRVLPHSLDTIDLKGQSTIYLTGKYIQGVSSRHTTCSHQGQKERREERNRFIKCCLTFRPTAKNLKSNIALCAISKTYLFSFMISYFLFCSTESLLIHILHNHIIILLKHNNIKNNAADNFDCILLILALTCLHVTRERKCLRQNLHDVRHVVRGVNSTRLAVLLT